MHIYIFMLSCDHVKRYVTMIVDSVNTLPQTLSIHFKGSGNIESAPMYPQMTLSLTKYFAQQQFLVSQSHEWNTTTMSRLHEMLDT